MSGPLSSLKERGERLNAMYTRIEAESAKSLVQYLGNVVIDARPEPKSWGLLWEDWQGQITRPLIPAMEFMAGLRDDYHGPRAFWYTLPRGHDKTGLIGRLANWAMRFSPRYLSGCCAAASRKQAKLLTKSMRDEQRLNPWLATGLETYQMEVRGPGGVLDVLSSDAATSSGRKDDLIINDELTFWKGDRGRELFDVLWSGSEKRPNSVFIIITNAGIVGTWQERLREQARASKDWFFYEAPASKMLASWMTPEAIERIRRMLPPKHARRVLDNEWVLATETPLIEYTTDIIPNIEDCGWPGAINYERRYSKGKTPELYIGVDIGRSHDRTVISVVEKCSDGILRLRSLTVLVSTPYEEQFRIISSICEQPGVLAARIDKGGIGHQLSETLCNRFRQAEGIALSAGWQGVNGLKLKTYLTRGMLKIPNDGDLHIDMQLVDEVSTGANGVPTLRTRRDSNIGHADRFWSIALALSAVPDEDVRHNVGRSVPRAYVSSHA